MLRNLSPLERETLVRLASSGPGANVDQSAMAKLFTMLLVEVNAERRVVLTDRGREFYDAIMKQDANTGVVFPSNSQPHNK